MLSRFAGASKIDLANVFKNRLKYAILQKSEEKAVVTRSDLEGKSPETWVRHDLAKNIGLTNKAVENWLTPESESIPYPHILGLIADYFAVSIGWLLGEGDDATAPTPARDMDSQSLNVAIASYAGDNFDKERKRVIQSSSRALWIQLRSGKTFNNADSLSGTFENTLKNHKPSVRLLICDPQNEAVKEMLAYRLAYTDKNRVAGDITETVNKVKELASKYSLRLEIAYCPYLYSTLGYIANPPENEGDKDDGGRAVMLVAGFHKRDIRDAIMIPAQRATNPKIFNQFVIEYNRLWGFTQKKGRIEKY